MVVFEHLVGCAKTGGMCFAPKLAGAKDDGSMGEDDQGKKEGRAVAYSVHLDVQGLHE
jgi:hypothetical protein